MDFVAVVIIPLTAIAAVVIVGLSAVFRRATIRYAILISFFASFLAWLLVLRPWEEIRLDEWPFLLASAGLIAIPVAGGTLIGTALGLSLSKAINRLRGRRGTP